MSSEQTQITTVHPEKRAGVMMQKSLYDAIVDFIVITIKTTESINMAALLSKSQDSFPQAGNISWYIYQVKLDLEARGFIRIATDDIHKFGIRLTPTGLKNFENVGLK